MRRIFKTLVTFLTIAVTVSLMATMFVSAQGDDGYETVGGEVAPISFITTFLVPALIIIGVFAALVILGIIRIKFKSATDENA